MKQHKVLSRFKDKHNNFVYEKGDIYPKKGIKVDESRIKELSSKNNDLGKALIKEVAPKAKKKVFKNDKSST